MKGNLKWGDYKKRQLEKAEGRLNFAGAMGIQSGILWKSRLGRWGKVTERHGEKDTRSKREYYQRSGTGGDGVVVAEGEKRHDETKVLEEDIKDGTRKANKESV